jgi:transketolase
MGAPNGEVREFLLMVHEALAAAREVGAIVTAEEDSVIGGLGSGVAEIVCERHPVPMRRIGVRDLFGVSGEPEELLELYGLKAANIAETAKVVLGESARA